MTVNDIARVEIDWMEKYVNDPHVTFVLKKDRVLPAYSSLIWRQYGNVFVAQDAGYVAYLAHDRNDHNGFGGSVYKLRMADDWDQSKWTPCIGRTEPRWGSGGCYFNPKCEFNPECRILSLTGPWHCSTVSVKAASGVDCIDVATLEGPHRIAISNPKYYQRMRRCGHRMTGTPMGVSYTVDFAREVIDRLAPHVELWQGDYGWTVKRRDMPPKNPRRRQEPMGHAFLSGEQSAIVFG